MRRGLEDFCDVLVSAILAPSDSPLVAIGNTECILTVFHYRAPGDGVTYSLEFRCNGLICQWMLLVLVLYEGTDFHLDAESAYLMVADCDAFVEERWKVQGGDARLQGIIPVRGENLCMFDAAGDDGVVEPREFCYVQLGHRTAYPQVSGNDDRALETDAGVDDFLDGVP